MKRRNCSENTGSRPDSSASARKSGDLLGLTVEIGGGQTDRRLVPADLLGDLEPLGEQVHERGIDVVDARSILRQLLVGHGLRDATGSPAERTRSATFAACPRCRCCSSTIRFPISYRDLVDDRATIVGSGTDDGLDLADAVIAGAVRQWDAAEFALAPNLTVISRVGVGYDNVDVADAHAAGVIVCNAPLAPMVSTAEHTMALILAVTKHLPHQMATIVRRAQG